MVLLEPFWRGGPRGWDFERLMGLMEEEKNFFFSGQLEKGVITITFALPK